MVNVADWKLVPNTALMVAVCCVEIPLVAMANVAEEAPLGMMTVAGTLAVGLIDDKVTVTPPAGANPFKETVPTAVFPPTTGFGATESEANDAWVMERVAV
jgi:hypothetical protein